MFAFPLSVTVAVGQASKVQPKTTAGYRIAGTVVSKIDSHPLAQARISLRDLKDAQNLRFAVTAEDGKFEFTGLAAGKYSINGAKRGFISADYDQHEQFSTAIVTGVGLDTENLLLRLAPAAVIAGKVLDEVGESVRRATVTLYFDDHSTGADEIRRSRTSQTDDQGVFEMATLTPGAYFLSASATPWYAVHPTQDTRRSPHESPELPASDRSLDVAYPTTYYADVTDADSATPIPVRGGERLEVDIHLNPVPALHLFFHVADNGGNGFNMPQLQQPALGGVASVPGTSGRMISPGTVEITGVPAGRYNVRMGGRGQSMQMSGVDLNRDGEQIDTSKGEALSSVKVSAHLVGESVLPRNLTVRLRSEHHEPAAFQEFDAKGEALLREIPAGKYEVSISDTAKRYSIVRLTADGAAVSGHILTVPAGASASISLTLAGGNGEVQGTVTRAGKPFAGAMVVLVPKVPQGDHDLFRRDQSDLDGTFTLHGVVPGSYTVVAIENGWEMDWSQPLVMAAYTKLGQRIEVSGGPPLKLADAIEVQSK